MQGRCCSACPWAQVTRALAFRGPASTGIIGECGAGALDYASWPDGLTLYAQDGELIGWALDERANGALGTAANVGPGRTRRDLESAYSAEFSQTTLGTEFAAGGVYGVLDGPGPSALITAMWGGTSCNFR